MATFHVDYINGSDANDGSAANPYATMKFALETNSMGAGDDLKVAGSAMTTRDAAATYSDAVGYDVLTTSSDLTGVISVGDIVQINPPPGNTQYQDWMHAQVTAITATTITYFEELHLPGTAATGNWTIKTIDSVYSSASATMEEWVDATVGANVDIIGGYNTAFTSIIGSTYFRRSGLGAGSTSGTAIRNKYANNVLAIANFENFSFLQWNECIRGEFGGSIYGNNLLSYTSGGNVFAYFGMVLGKNNVVPNTFVINGNGNYGNFAYIQNAVADSTIEVENNIKIYAGNKILKAAMTFNDVTIWNPGSDANGADFGATYSLQIYQSSNICGALTFNTIDNARSGFRKGHNLFFTSNAGITAKPSAINVIDGGVAGSYWDFTDSQASKLTPFISSVICPTGFLIKDQQIRNGRDQSISAQPVFQVIDGDGVWLKQEGGYMRVSDDFDTGDSSKLFFMGNGAAYATGPSQALLFQFTKIASTPASITLRGKTEANGSSSSSTTFALKLANYIQWSNFPNSSFTTATYTDKVIALPTGYTWDQIPVGGVVQIGIEFSTSNNQLVYIDSVTVNY